MKRIYQLVTGAEVPEGAVYLSTTIEDRTPYGGCMQVWHYFLIEVEESTNKGE